MKTVLFLLIFSIFPVAIFAQQRPQRLSFLIVIDNEFPSSSITNSEFLLKDSLGKIKYRMPLDYFVGNAYLNKSHFRKLFAKNKDVLFIKFKNLSTISNVEQLYELPIPRELFNTTYNILRIYTTEDKSNVLKYNFKDGKQFLFQTIFPGYRTVLRSF